MSKKLIICLIALLSFNFMSAQSSISGKVTDTNGELLPGVTIIIKGTSVGNITNFNGEYSLNTSNLECVLVFSYLGMKTQEIKYTGQKVIDVVLEEETNRLNEIVVIGYGAVKKRDVTGSISSIKDSVIGVSKTPNLFDAIQGRIAGVNIVSQSGEPGSSVNFNVRGSNSVFSAGSPLFIIDGVQIDINDDEVASAGVGSSASMDPLATINPLDIESMEVLKDASATSIYGSRGANGVIIITTKSGKKGDLTVEYTSSIGFGEALNKIDVISPEEYVLYRESRDPGNSFTNISDGTPRDFSTISSKNWQDEALRTSVVNNHFISARGATEKTSYSASIGAVKQGVLL
jgi:TonB-linked SusC/RagA family outer membrane protein